MSKNGFAAEERRTMKAVFSTESKNKVFHLCGCPYEKRIRRKNKVTTGTERAEKMRYHACTYCCSMRGYYNMYRKQLDAEAEKQGFRVFLVKKTDTLYIRTDIGAWKIFITPDVHYRLFHLNEYNEEMTDEQIIHGAYHRQSDVQPASSPLTLINYITKHDKAKKIIAVDYRKLPKGTQREKEYYRRAKKKDERKKKKRVYELLDCVSRGETPASMWVSLH